MVTIGCFYGKQPQDVFVDTWLKDALCRLNKPLAANPDLADEVIHRLRGVLLEAGYSGLIRANEIFQDWLLGPVYPCRLAKMVNTSPFTCLISTTRRTITLWSASKFSLPARETAILTWCSISTGCRWWLVR